MPLKIFLCYAREDEVLQQNLEKHLKTLQRAGLIDLWYDREILPGRNWKLEIDNHLNTSDIILLLVSADFIASDYCYGVELQRAMERHRLGEACVIPIILRPVVWKETPIGELQALPTDGKPITQWDDSDAALLDVVSGIRKVVGIYSKQVDKLPPNNTNTYKDTPIAPEIQERPSGTLLCIYRGHPVFTKGTQPDTYSVNSIITVTWSPKGPYVASASRANRSVHVWHAFTGKKIQTYSRHSSLPFHLTWSPDGTCIASASEQSIHLWHAFTRQHILTYEGHYHLMLSFNEVSGIIWSPSGTYIASAAGKVVQIWHAGSGDTVATYRGHAESVIGIAWLPDGKHVVSGGWDGTVQVWSIDNGRNISTYQCDFKIMDMALSPDGKLLAVSGEESGVIRILDITTGACVVTYQGYPGRFSHSLWSPTGRYCATTFGDSPFDKLVQIWNPKTGNTIFTYIGHDNIVYHVAWSPDDLCIASAGEESTVHVWRAV